MFTRMLAALALLVVLGCGAAPGGTPVPPPPPPQPQLKFTLDPSGTTIDYNKTVLHLQTPTGPSTVPLTGGAYTKTGGPYGSYTAWLDIYWVERFTGMVNNFNGQSVPGLLDWQPGKSTQGLFTLEIEQPNNSNGVPSRPLLTFKRTVG
ncbi:hypothetical protein [Actinoplanes sp. NPDC089786]|uniref:hypothetical protein n=1 Tax=Actinoplanes sp. NPDC089786 TaxID=3155185 RepID=UPI0034133A7F